MSFLDSLENNLKSLESREDASGDRQQQERQREREKALLRDAAPYIEKLKRGPFTEELLRQATRIAHGMRTKLHIAWLGNTLRLEARDRKLELRPTPAGVMGVFIENQTETRTLPVDLEGSPEQLAREWLLPPAS